MMYRMRNTTMELLLHRRSVRSFQDKPISEEDKALLEQATLRAPTAGNMALYSVIDVTDVKGKQKLADLCDHQQMVAAAPLVWVFVSDYQKWVDYFKGEKSPEKSGIPFTEPGWGDMHLGLQDAVIAAESAVIAAESLGIGSCYIGDVLENGEKIQQLLNLPQYTVPACMVIFGYKKDSGVTKLNPRCPADAIFMKDRYERHDLSEIRKAYAAQEEQSRELKRLPFANTGSLADFYYGRKYTSAFMKEMNRSVAYWFDRWKDKSCN